MQTSSPSDPIALLNILFKLFPQYVAFFFFFFNIKHILVFLFDYMKTLENNNKNTKFP